MMVILIIGRRKAIVFTYPLPATHRSCCDLISMKSCWKGFPVARQVVILWHHRKRWLSRSCIVQVQVIPAPIIMWTCHTIFWFRPELCCYSPSHYNPFLCPALLLVAPTTKYCCVFDKWLLHKTANNWKGFLTLYLVWSFDEEEKKKVAWLTTFGLRCNRTALGIIIMSCIQSVPYIILYGLWVTRRYKRWLCEFLTSFCGWKSDYHVLFVESKEAHYVTFEGLNSVWNFHISFDSVDFFSD